MRIYDFALLAGVSLFAVLLLLLVSVLSPDGDLRKPAAAPGAEVLAVDDALASTRRHSASPDSARTDEAPAVWVLELGDAPGGPRGPESSPGPTPEPGRHEGASAGLRGLPEGRGSITFALQDGSDRPLPDVSVLLRSVRLEGAAEEAVTGGRGEARFIRLAAGSYSYWVQAPGRPTLASAAPVRLGQGEHKHLALRLGGSGLSISGRVMNQTGEPVPGIEVSAVRFVNTSVRSAEAMLSRDLPAQRTWALEDGSYQIQGLEEGEYELRTKATNRYASARKMVRAGFDSADLVLAEGVRVRGTVTSTSGEPLTSVRVASLQQGSRSTFTDDQGNYALELGLPHDEKAYTVQFHLQDYEDEVLELSAAESAGAREARLDAVLKPATERPMVSGTVRTWRGEPVPRETVYLRSGLLNATYRAVSDSRGDFFIPHVRIGSDYRLWVQPKDRYRDYSQAPIDVTRDGLSLDVVLEPLAAGGRLSGRMIDVEGNPIPGFRLWLGSIEAVRSSLPVSSDEGGYFLVEEAPEGAVLFDTRAYPLLRVSGIRVPERGEKEAFLVLDWGDHVMDGSVLDDRGRPVPGAELMLSWSHASAGTQSHSRRKTVTDGDGTFRFTQLGPGRHALEVRAPGFRPASENLEVDPYAAEVEIRLEPSPD